jgi:antitoxin HicB
MSKLPAKRSRTTAAKSRSAIEREIDRLMALPYRREYIPNEDGTWFAHIVELPRCMTEGDTEAEAAQNLHDAMREWLRVQLEDGDPIPLPLAAQSYSGKFIVRIAPTLHREIAAHAEREGVSLNAFAAMALAVAVGERQTAVSPDRSARR